VTDEESGTAVAKVEELGGQAGAVTEDMGPYWTSVCTDDQGTPFGLMSPVRSSRCEVCGGSPPLARGAPTGGSSSRADGVSSRARAAPSAKSR